MTTRYHRFQRIAKKEFHVAVPVLEGPEWAEVIEADPRTPRSVGQLRRLWQEITAYRRHRLPFRVEVVRGILRRRIEECGEEQVAHFFTGLSNPLLDESERADIEELIDVDIPCFDEQQETDHFTLRWTRSSSHKPDNIADASIVAQTGEYLETAYERFESVFGRAPYAPAGRPRIDVNFWDISGLGTAAPPDGPISLNSAAWTAEPSIRQPASAHGLFHKLQYAYGFRTVWTPEHPYKWFSEGSASWAEVFIWQRVSRAYKINDLFINPDLNLYDAEYSALPFWIFFDARQRDAQTDTPLVDYLERYELSGNEEQALGQIIDAQWPESAVHGQLDNFFALFSRERRLGAWRQTPSGENPYPTILGPDGAALAPVPAMTNVPLGSGDVYSTWGAVSGLGSDYFRFELAPDARDKQLSVSVNGSPTGDFSYYQIWEKKGAFQQAAFPALIAGSFTFNQVIDLAKADALVFIISGRGKGGEYGLRVTLD
jgi:hypothetical protein